MVDDAAIDVRRFLVGDGRSEGQGYVFGHPRLQQYFEDRLLKGVQARFWQKRFCSYMKSVLSDLTNARITPADVPKYLTVMVAPILVCARTRWRTSSR